MAKKILDINVIEYPIAIKNHIYIKMEVFFKQGFYVGNIIKYLKIHRMGVGFWTNLFSKHFIPFH